MTYEEFVAAYPFGTRKEAAKAIKDGRINGWAESGRLGKDERFRIRVIVAKPVPVKKMKEKRVTAASICRKVYLTLLRRDGEVDRDEYLDRAIAAGVSKVTAQTRFADYKDLDGE